MSGRGHSPLDTSHHQQSELDLSGCEIWTGKREKKNAGGNHALHLNDGSDWVFFLPPPLFIYSSAALYSAVKMPI